MTTILMQAVGEAIWAFLRENSYDLRNCEMNNPIDLNLSWDQILQLPPRERIPFIQLIRLRYPRSEEILEKIRKCFNDQANSVEPPCLLLVGPSGAGKTTILEIIRDEHPRIVTETRVDIPLLMSSVDVPATLGNFASRLLLDLGDPRYANGTVGNRLFRVEEYIKDCHTIMLILDELQHFVDRDSDLILRTVTDRLKSLIKLHKLACILTGLQDEAEQVVDSNPQLARLFPDPIILEPFGWDESRPDTIKEFRTLLSQLEKALPLNEKSNLSTRDLAWRIFVATDGLMGFLMALIREATQQALEHGLECLDEAVLKEAFDKKLGSQRRDISNPFIGPSPVYIPREKRKKPTNGKNKS